MSVTKHGIKSGAAHIVWLGLIFVSIILLNLIVLRTTARVDLTHDQRFTLAEASVTTAGELPGPVVVEAFFSGNLPPQLEQMRRELNDLLAEFSAHSDGQLSYEFVDPSAAEEHQERADSFDLPAFPLQVESEDELSVRAIYAAIVMIYDDGSEDRVEVIPQILPGMNYEYELTRALRSVTREGGPPTLGVVIGDGGFLDMFLQVPMDPRNPRARDELIANFESQLGQFFDDLYEFKLVDITAEGGFSDDVDGLFMFGPTVEFTEEMLQAVDSFIISGRPVALFVSPYKMEALQFDQPGFEGMTIPAENRTGLDELLENYGVLLRHDAVFDFNAAQVSAEPREVQLGALRGGTWVPLIEPRLPELTEISETSVLVPNMNLVAFLPIDRNRPLSQSTLALTATAHEAVQAESLQVVDVLSTSGTSYRLESEDVERLETIADNDLIPFLEAYEESPESPDIELERGPFVVAMTVEGRMQSAFAAEEDVEAETEIETEEGRLFVVANGYWVQAMLGTDDPLFRSNTLRMLPGRVAQTVLAYRDSNRLLLRNTADWLAQDSDLVRIRSRGQPTFFDTGELDEGEKRFYKYFNIAGVPALFCFLGLVGYLIRQARRARITDRYDSKGK